MGTVPDSLRSAKVSLIAACSKEDVLGELRFAHPGAGPAQVREHVNGLPSAPEEAELSPGAAAVALMQACEHEPSQPGMSSAVLHEAEKSSSPLSSPASPQLSASGVSPALSPCCRPQRDHPEHTMPAADRLITPPSTGDKPLAPAEPEVPQGRPQRTSDAEAPCEEPPCPVGDSGDGSKEQVGPDFPARQTSQELVAETLASPAGSVHSAPEGTQGEEETQATGDAQSKSCDPKSRGCGCSASAQPSGMPGPQAPTPETPQTSNLAGSSSFCAAPAPEPGAAALPGSRFKEASTMTTYDRSELGARPSRAQRDAEVQAVASVESRSVCTSPGILPAFLREVPAPDSFEPQEELRVVCLGGSGRSNTGELSDRARAAQGSGPAPGALRGMPIQATSAASQEGGKGVNLPGEILQASGRKGSPTGAQDTVQEDGESSGMSRGTEDLPSQQLAGGADRSLQASPVDQGSERSSRLAKAGQVNPMPSERAGEAPNGHKTEPNCRLSDLGGPASKGDQREALEPTVREKPAAPGREKQEESAGPSSLDGTAGPETQSLLLHPKSQEGGDPASAANPSPLRKHQEDPTEENRVAKSAASLSLPPDCSGESSPGSGKRTPGRTVRASPRRASRVSEFLREQKLNVTAAVGLAPGERKKQQDAKLHLKQSKRVRDVVWDEQGMTWEVYGASLDPESLGVAIQNHLQRQIREHEKLIKAQSRRSVSSDTSSHKKLKGRQHSVLQSMLQNFRRPNCCVRPAPSSVLD